jgi:hypothetical protein
MSSVVTNQRLPYSSAPDGNRIYGSPAKVQVRLLVVNVDHATDHSRNMSSTNGELVKWLIGDNDSDVIRATLNRCRCLPLASQCVGLIYGSKRS